MNSIQMIKIDKLQPHPDNPRKNVGDVSELADSIRHSGIMQNLTVVPHEGGYRVVIGHRRLAAAKEAGLAELPCVVSDMDPIEQLHTMMSENMQRKDLTPPEEAWGVQMLLDLGETPEAVQKKTGMSRTTFYHRKAMAALPAEELQASYERGGTLADYVALEGIKDQETREKLLKDIGTDNFPYELRKAKEDQAYQEKAKTVLLLLEPVAKRLKKRDNIYWNRIDLRSSDFEAGLKRIVAEIEKDVSSDFSFFIGKGSWERDLVFIYRHNEAESAEKKPSDYEIQEQKRKEKYKALERLDKSFRAMHKDFICNLSEDGSWSDPEAKINKVLPFYISRQERTYKPTVMKEIFFKKGENEELNQEFNLLCLTRPCAVMLAVLEKNLAGCFDYYGKYAKTWAEDGLRFLELLVSIGYQESDEEKAYWSGKHKLFKRK